MSRDELTEAMARACAKVVNSISHLSDAQMVYLLGVVDGMEGSAAAANKEPEKPALREVG